MLEHSNWNPYRFMRRRLQFSCERLGLSEEIGENAWKVLLDGDCKDEESVVDLGCSLYAAILLAGKRSNFNDIARAAGISENSMKSRLEEIRKSLEKL